MPAALANLVPAGRARLTQRWMLVFAAVICLVTAVMLTRTAIEQLNSSTALADVDAAGGLDTAAKLVDAIASTTLMIMFAGAAAVLTELALPQPMELLRGVGSGKFFGGMAGYIAIVFFNGRFAAWLLTARPYPGSAVTGPDMLGRDLAESVGAALIEELLLFAIPLALLGMSTTRRGIKWGGRALVIALRFGIHLYYGVGFAAVLAIPWIIGAWLLYRAIGTIWPLIIGHTLYDAAVFTMMRTDELWVSPALWVVALVGGVLLLATVRRWGRSARPAAAAGPPPPLHR